MTIDVRETIAWSMRLADPRHDVDERDVRVAFTGTELLADWYDDWVLLEREHVRQLRLHALERLCERLITSRRYDDAMQVAQRSVRDEPLRESAHRSVIQIHLAEGNPSEALRHYRFCRDLLRQELGVEPSSQTKALIGHLTAR